MELYDILKRLSEAFGPSGFEGPVFEAARELLAPYADEITTDSMGNLFAWRRCGRENAPLVLLEAHMDEIGLIVTSIEDGFLRFGSIGGVDARILPGREVTVLTDEPLYGVIDAMPPHVLSKGDMDKSIDAEKLAIDVGLSQERAEALIPCGTPVSLGLGVSRLDGDIVCGKALDDRLCAAVIIKTAERLSVRELDCDLVCLLATQEEVGLRGAKTGVYSANPDVAICLDVTHARTPDAPKSVRFELGGGAAIGVGPNLTRSVSGRLIDIAREHGIKYGVEAEGGATGTDAWVAQVSRGGVATGLISVPLRYMHTPVETGSLLDAEAAAQLLERYVLSAGKE